MHGQVCVRAQICKCTRTHTHVYKTLLSQCAHRWLYDPHASNRETAGPLRLLFTSAYNAISFYSASPFSLPGSLRYRLRAYNVGEWRYAARGKKTSSLFRRFLVSQVFRPRTPGRILPWLRFSLTLRCCAFSIPEPVTSSHFAYTRM